MKKFYFFSLMAATALTMSAANEVSISRQAVESSHSMAKTFRTAVKNAPATEKAMATDFNAETWVSLGTGKYVDSAIADCYGATSDAVDVEVFEAEGKTGLYKVVGVWPDMFTEGVGTLYVDATDAGFVVIESQYTGIDDTEDGELYIASFSYVGVNEYGLTKDDIVGTYADYNITMSDKVINIPAGSVCLRWPNAPADSSYDTDASQWYNYGEEAGLLVLPGGTYEDPWGEAIDATMVETIISPSFQKPNTNPYTIQIKKHKTKETYRLIGPWRQLFAAIGSSDLGPNLDIDVSDPSNLLVELQYIGIGSYNIFSESWYNALYEDTALDDALKITLTENADGTSTITFPYHSMEIFDESTNKFYYACSDQENLSTITFKSFSGVESISLDNNSNAPVEYFNLQGIRIANPTEGQLVIKRQGTSVSKIVVR